MSVKSSIKKADELTLDLIGSDQPIIYEDVKYYYDNGYFTSWKSAMICQLDDLVDGLYLFNAIDSNDNEPLPFMREPKQLIDDLIESIIEDFPARGNFYLLQCIPNIKYEGFISSLPDWTLGNQSGIVGMVIEHLERRYVYWIKKNGPKYVTKY